VREDGEQLIAVSTNNTVANDPWKVRNGSGREMGALKAVGALVAFS